MRRPTQMESFEALYTIAAGNGRGEALFGNSIGLARDVYERTLAGDDYPTAYLEFPLLGAPGFDILSVHGYVEPGATFAPGAGYGYDGMLSWYASVCKKGSHIGLGIEMDTSDGETERAGVYLQQRGRVDLVEPFLNSVGEGARAQSYLDALSRMPTGWPPSYVGLFPGREGTPLRIGGYMQREEMTRCAQSPAYLEDRFHRIGFAAFNKTMLERCAEFMQLSPSVDFQFDIMPDGSLGNTFGLSLSFNETKPRESRVCMETGYGATIMRALQGWGLADDRWKLIASAAFARHVGYTRDDGTEGRFALCIRFNYAKVKFTDGEPEPAKFYLLCESGDMEA